MDNPNKPVRVRLAPSPTGNLHVGTARTALFNELFARQAGGSFIVRIEDTDKARSKQEFEENIFEGLRWLGLTWDESTDTEGPYGPYRQSERTEQYIKELRRLLEEDKAHYCYCPPAKEGKEKPVCECSSTPPAKDAAERTSIKLQVEPQTITFQDEVRGEVSVHTDSFGGSFTIARTISDPLFHLAVVVDDAAMEISHVIRGEDHLHNTIKHILLQQALGYPRPAYAHLPMLLDEQRRKLSKRSGETSLLAYRDLGYLPEAMLNYLALLGWSPKNDREFFTHKELIEAFSFSGVQKSGAIFSLQKLNAVNKEYIKQLTNEELLSRTTPFLEKEGISLADTKLLLQALATEKERVATLAELPEAIRFFLPDWNMEYDPLLLVWRTSTPEATQELLKKLAAQLEDISAEQYTEEYLQETLMKWIDENSLGRGDMLWPMRVALTGKRHSPGPFEVAAILGKTEALRRLRHAQDKLLV